MHCILYARERAECGRCWALSFALRSPERPLPCLNAKKKGFGSKLAVLFVLPLPGRPKYAVLCFKSDKWCEPANGTFGSRAATFINY